MNGISQTRRFSNNNDSILVSDAVLPIYCYDTHADDVRRCNSGCLLIYTRYEKTDKSYIYKV